MRFEGILTSWNDDRGFGRIESSQGGEPIFVHVSAWPRGGPRPVLHQAVSFEVEVGPKGKRARKVQLTQARRMPGPRRQARAGARGSAAPWGTATLAVIPAFLLLYLALAFFWKLPREVAGVYLGLSVVAFLAYAFDKSAAARGRWRISEHKLHMLALAGGWPGALLAQQFLRHKSAKQSFRQVFWGTVFLNIVGLVLLARHMAHLPTML
ncbi:cold shock and DUF1294 domain-containing protein [Ideonella margarita]|uniref:Cold shock and DUF1294 domain-containing protein n=1 Tax=Ideonella margarita TaxID=2984191 RepID=A0ABU9CC77_9BURK